MKTFPKLILTAVLPLILFLFSVNAQENETDTKSAKLILEKKQPIETPPAKTEKETETPSAVKTSAEPENRFSEAIADNSFLIEEAYNQEAGIMQTVTTCAWFRRPQSDVGCTITQEFPVKNQRHQLSYTLPLSFLDSSRVKGAGDISVNYRYQLTGERDWAVVAPRLSLILPTGSFKRGLGSGATGLQFNLPVSKRLSNDFVAHFNAGTTFLRKAKGIDSDGNSIRRNLTNFHLGGSVIWLTQKRANFVFEYLENFSSAIGDDGKVRRFNEHIVNPGVRFAIDIGHLQIVPGIAVPTSFTGNNSRTGLFFYLSLEHPFKRSKRSQIVENNEN